MDCHHWTKILRSKDQKGNTSIVEDFNKIQYYVSCLKNPHLKVKGFHVGALKLNERITAFIVTWMLTPRGNNHVILPKEHNEEHQSQLDPYLQGPYAKVYEVK